MMEVIIGMICDESEIYKQIKNVLEKHIRLLVYKFEEMDQVLPECDLIILDFNQKRNETKDYMPILQIKGYREAPILAVLEYPTISDQLMVLAMGALDVVERPVTNEVLKSKISDMLEWGWYRKWRRTKFDQLYGRDK